MSGQKGAGNVAIPTLAFSSLAEFREEARKRGLGTNDLNAIRVQPHKHRSAGQGYVCYENVVTTFDDQQGCILAVHLSYGCYGPGDSITANEAWAKEAHIRLMDVLYREHNLVVGLGEWVHDPVPPELHERITFETDKSESEEQ